MFVCTAVYVSTRVAGLCLWAVASSVKQNYACLDDCCDCGCGCGCGCCCCCCGRTPRVEAGVGYLHRTPAASTQQAQQQVGEAGIVTRKACCQQVNRSMPMTNNVLSLAACNASHVICFIIICCWRGVTHQLAGHTHKSLVSHVT
jgi:hypothetical protein